MNFRWPMLVMVLGAFGLSLLAPRPVAAAEGAPVCAPVSEAVYGIREHDALHSVTFHNSSATCAYPVAIAVYRTAQARHTLNYVEHQTYLGHQTFVLAPQAQQRVNYLSVLPDSDGRCVQADPIKGDGVIVDGPPHYTQLVDSYYHWDETCMPAASDDADAVAPVAPVSTLAMNQPRAVAAAETAALPAALPSAGAYAMLPLAVVTLGAALLVAGALTRLRSTRRAS